MVGTIHKMNRIFVHFHLGPSLAPLEKFEHEDFHKYITPISQIQSINIWESNDTPPQTLYFKLWGRKQWEELCGKFGLGTLEDFYGGTHGFKESWKGRSVMNSG